MCCHCNYLEVTSGDFLKARESLCLNSNVNSKTRECVSQVRYVPFGTCSWFGETQQTVWKKIVPQAFQTCSICFRTASFRAHATSSSGDQRFSLLLGLLLSAHCPQIKTSFGFPLVSCLLVLFSAHTSVSLPIAYRERERDRQTDKRYRVEGKYQTSNEQGVSKTCGLKHGNEIRCSCVFPC